MIRGLFFCAIACGIAAPVMAGERSAAAPGARAFGGFTLPVADRFPGYDGALTISGDIVVRLRSAPTPTVALVDFENRTVSNFDVTPAEPQDEPGSLASPHAAVDWRALRAWRLTERLAPTTNRANGFYAVRDSLADYRKPRAFRPSALSTMLVLRIDGKDESPALSVGGGGVAAAIWRVMPQ